MMFMPINFGNFTFNNKFTYNPAAFISYNINGTNLYNTAQIYAQRLLSNISKPAFKPYNFGTLTNNTTPKLNFSSTQQKNGLSLFGKNQNASLWTSIGYNANKGYELAQNALSNAVGWTGYCARHVKKAIANSNLGEYKSGHAYNMIGILDQNPKFKKISPDGINLKTLPAGCVLVYGRGVGGYSSKYGHVEITTGTGKAVSDGITNNLYKKPTAIYMPIKTDIAIA